MAAAIIYLGRRSPVGSSTLPAAFECRIANSQWRVMYIHPPNGLTPSAFVETGRLSLPIWACWRWGLPCRDCHQPRGALLPHHFTLTERNVKTSKNRNVETGVLTF